MHTFNPRNPIKPKKNGVGGAQKRVLNQKIRPPIARRNPPLVNPLSQKWSLRLFLDLFIFGGLVKKLHRVGTHIFMR